MHYGHLLQCAGDAQDVLHYPVEKGAITYRPADVTSNTEEQIVMISFLFLFFFKCFETCIPVTVYEYVFIQ